MSYYLFFLSIFVLLPCQTLHRSSHTRLAPFAVYHISYKSIRSKFFCRNGDPHFRRGNNDIYRIYRSKGSVNTRRSNLFRKKNYSILGKSFSSNFVWLKINFYQGLVTTEIASSSSEEVILRMLKSYFTLSIYRTVWLVLLLYPLSIKHW